MILALVALPVRSQLKKGSRFDKATNCLDCHEELQQEFRVPHKPMADGDCVSCHKAHGLRGALRLQKEEPDLCLQCHELAGLSDESGKRHEPVSDCSSCHSPVQPSPLC
jgi:predicted CXXCH cytochrome family protein